MSPPQTFGPYFCPAAPTGSWSIVSTRPHIVYLSFDGLLEPLGYSQVARVVMALAEGGSYRFTICSLEKRGDREEGHREQALAAELRRRRVRWRRATWSGGGTVIDVAKNVRAMTALVDQVVDEDGVDLFHARSYVAASVARQVGRRVGVPYLFDTRGLWIDERLERGLWFDGPVRRRAARRWEAALFEDAAGAVTLTELAADEIRRQRLGPWQAHRPLAVIPTCVDYGEFGLGGPGDAGGVSEAVAHKLQSSLVVGYIGSVNDAYRMGASLRLFDHLRSRRQDAHLLCLTGNPPALLTHLERHRLAPSVYTVRRVDHRAMPGWLPFVDWGLLLRNTHRQHRSYLGAMPTKLGEFFAAGIRPVYAGHSQEVRQWVERAGSGHIIERCDEAGLRQAARVMATTPRCLHTLWGARWRTQNHFGLSSAVERYHDLYQKVLAGGDNPRLRVLFLTEGTRTPSSRFRVEQLVPHLQARGIACTVRPAFGDGYAKWTSTPAGPLYKLACSLQRLPQALDGDRFDVVFLQRPGLPFSEGVERLANWRNPHTIFDVDQGLVDEEDRLRGQSAQTMEAIASRCAHIICADESLASQTPAGVPTSVIPTVIDTERYRPGPPKTPDQQVVIGWMGRTADFDGLQAVAPVLERLAQRDDLAVHIVSEAPFEPLHDVAGVVHHRWSPDDELPLLQRFDVGIVPMAQDEAANHRSGLKALQCMAVAIPVVASPVGACRQILGDGKAGILAHDPPSFERALQELAADGPRRKRMGQLGRQIVKKHYCVDAVIDRYVELLEAVARRVDRPGQGVMRRAANF